MVNHYEVKIERKKWYQELGQKKALDKVILSKG
jgi:hypothetical protein